MKILSQRDPKWSNVRLGDSIATIGRYGCTTTDISMALDFFGMYRTPAELARTLDYTKEGLILWDSLLKVGLRLVKRADGRNDSDIRAALKDPKTVCLLQVQGNHWVLATSVRWLGGYGIADPWYGDIATTGRYKEQITGFAILRKNV